MPQTSPVLPVPSPVPTGIGASFVALREDAPPFEGTGRFKKANPSRQSAALFKKW
ncbi:hypothetical protein CHISP_3002 [Chitinispirillum alkaliphilum]|nr:hypothetical protein CHISP_3002 [Chitinispirillum alkaliphilum]